MDSNSNNELLLNPKRLKALSFNAAYSEGDTLLHQFVLHNSDPYSSADEKYIAGVLRSMSDVPANAHNRDGYCALHLAVWKNNLLMVEKLLSCVAGIDIDAAICHRERLHELNGYTALHLAAKLGYLSITEELVNRRATMDVKNIHNETALCVAAESGNLAMVEFLYSKGALVNGCVLTTPLHCAAQGSLEVVKFLVSKHAYINARDNYVGCTPLDLAVEAGNVEVAEHLIDHGARLKGFNDGFITPFFAAVGEKNLDMVKLFISKGENLKSSFFRFDTPFHYAEFKGNVEIAMYLLELGVYMPTEIDESTPPHVAACIRCLKVVRSLMNSGVDMEARNEDGSVPSHVAACATFLKTAGLLIRGAYHIYEHMNVLENVNNYDPDCCKTCLQIFSQATESLLNSGAGMEARNKDGGLLDLDK